MDKTLIEKLTELEASLKELEQDLSKVDISKDPQGYAEMAKRHSDLTPVSYTHLTLPTNREV